jgi:hypothetical protein
VSDGQFRCARISPGLFSYLDLLLHTGFSKERQGASIGELELARSLIKACSAPLMERAILRHPKNHVGQCHQNAAFQFGRTYFSSVCTENLIRIDYLTETPNVSAG